MRFDPKESTIPPTPTRGGCFLIGTLNWIQAPPASFRAETRSNAFYGDWSGAVTTAYFASRSEGASDRELAEAQARRDAILWEASIGGAVGATATGSGVLDTAGGGLGGLGDVQGTRGEPEISSPIDWGSIFLPQQKKEPVEVAIDWGGVLGGIVGLGTTYIETKYAQPTFQSFVGGPVPQPVPEGNIGGPEGITWGNGGAGAPPMATNAACPPAGSCGPRYLTYDCKTGQMTARRRRRRGKLLTAGRRDDLAFVIAMFGKGAASQIALAKAMS